VLYFRFGTTGKLPCGSLNYLAVVIASCSLERFSLGHLEIVLLLHENSTKK
jgi:hypothetical protein